MVLYITVGVYSQRRNRFIYLKTTNTLPDAVLASMKSNILSSFVLGTYCLLGLLIFDIKAETNVHSKPSKDRQTYSLTSRAEHGRSDLSQASSVKATASEPKIFKRAKFWTGEEEELLLELREQQLSWEEISEFFPERTWTAVKIKHSKLTQDPNRKRREPKRWSQEEQRLLLELKERDANTPWKEIAEYFPGRSASAVQSYYTYITTDSLAPKTFQGHWTAEENELLLRLARDRVPWSERAEYFNGRTLKSLRHQYAKLEVPKLPPPGKFTPEEDALIIKLFESGITVKDVARRLDRSITSIQRRRKRLEQSNQLRDIPSNRPYTAAELELIRELVERENSYRKIAADHFPGRTPSGVKQAYGRYRRQKQREGEEEED